MPQWTAGSLIPFEARVRLTPVLPPGERLLDNGSEFTEWMTSSYVRLKAVTASMC